ncbi:hypothetical protein RA307_18490 [Xanthobacteraceae bacterium Astr-EGSB]|uniref:hypothetical protein n=1 Tax=Astrobacterium formosum TaxID=3069710 RepID=UPI0027B7D8A5|nr:hypothetical protein [Xanthobacteraceae bacterium Astr-EGSB]
MVDFSLCVPDHVMEQGKATAVEDNVPINEEAASFVAAGPGHCRGLRILKEQAARQNAHAARAILDKAADVLPEFGDEPMQGRRPSNRFARPALLILAAILSVVAAVVLGPVPAGADWRQDAKEAAIKYGDQKKNELVKSQSKAAIVALYRKLYSAGAGGSASRALAEIAMSAPDLDRLAEEAATAYGSGDPDKAREASEKIAVKFGEQIARLGSTPQTRAMLGSIIGKADKVKEISQALGNATSGTASGKRAAAEYLGQALISLTPAAGVVGFYQSAHGAMKYAKGEYTDSKVEDFYKAYKNGDAKARELLLEQVRAGTAGFGYVVDERRRELEQERLAAIGDAADAAGDALREHLTKTTEEEIIGNIVASFDSRMAKERDDKAQRAATEQAEREAESMLGELAKVVESKHGAKAMQDNPYNLEKFLGVVRGQFNNIPELDPTNPLDLKLMAKTLSTGLVYGKNSKEYAAATAALQQARDAALALNKGAPCSTGSSTQQLAVRLWQQGKQLAAAGKTEAGLPMLKQSLLYCPDDRRAAQVAALEKAATDATTTLDGTYSGAVRGAAGGTLTFVVTGNSVSGTITGAYAGDAISGSLTGTVGANGAVSTAVTGTLFNAKGKHRYGFAGTLTGRIDAAAGAASGSWSAKNKYGHAAGSWSGARR